MEPPMPFQLSMVRVRGRRDAAMCGLCEDRQSSFPLKGGIGGLDCPYSSLFDKSSSSLRSTNSSFLPTPTSPLDNMSHFPGSLHLPSTPDHVELTWDQFLANRRESMTRLGLSCDIGLAIRDWNLLHRYIQMMYGVQESPKGPLDCSDEGKGPSPLFTEIESTTSSSAHDEHTANHLLSTRHSSVADEIPTPDQPCFTLSPHSDVGQLPYTSTYPVTGDFHVTGPSSIHTDAPTPSGGDPSLHGQTPYNYLASLPLPFADNLWEQSGESVPLTPVPLTSNTGHNALGLLSPENTPALQFQGLPAGSSNELFAYNDPIFDHRFWNNVQNPGCHFPSSVPPHTAVPHPTTSTLAPPPFPSPIHTIPPLPTPVDAFFPAPGSAGQFGQDVNVSVPLHLWNDITKILEMQTPPRSAQQQNGTDTGVTEVIIRGCQKNTGVNVWFQGN